MNSCLSFLQPLSILCHSFKDIDTYTTGFPRGNDLGLTNIFRAVKHCLPGPVNIAKFYLVLLLTCGLQNALVFVCLSFHMIMLLIKFISIKHFSILKSHSCYIKVDRIAMAIAATKSKGVFVCGVWVWILISKILY